MDGLIAGLSIWYIFDQACTSVYDATIKPISDWVNEKEKEYQDNTQKQKDIDRQHRKSERIRKNNEIRTQYGIPVKSKVDDPPCFP